MNKIKTFLSQFPRTALMLGSTAFVLFTNVAHAASQVQSPITDEQDLQTLMCNIISWFFWIVLVVSVIMVLFAAFTYVTARDDQEKTSRARKTLTYAAIGIAVALIAAGVPSIVSSIFPNNPGASLSDTCTF